MYSRNNPFFNETFRSRKALTNTDIVVTIADSYKKAKRGYCEEDEQ